MLFDNLPTTPAREKRRAPYTRRGKPLPQMSLLAQPAPVQRGACRPKLARVHLAKVTPKLPSDYPSGDDRKAAFRAVVLDLTNPHPRMSDAWYKRRIERGWRVAKFRGVIRDFADVEGIVHSTARKFLMMHAQDLHRALLDGVLPGSLTAARRLDRLQHIAALLDAGHTMTTVAGELDMDKVSLAAFLREWAPNGIDAAIADERDAIEADAADAGLVAA